MGCSQCQRAFAQARLAELELKLDEEVYEEKVKLEGSFDPLHSRLLWTQATEGLLSRLWISASERYIVKRKSRHNQGWFR